jgi:hypothetical protein
MRAGASSAEAAREGGPVGGSGREQVLSFAHVRRGIERGPQEGNAVPSPDTRRNKDSEQDYESKINHLAREYGVFRLTRPPSSLRATATQSSGILHSPHQLQLV